jgi:hypothetical protein
LPKPTTVIGLLLLTFGSLAVHGYHPYAEDAEIYLPGVEKILNPALFPVGTEFFQSHASLTLFPHLIAFSVRLSHLPFDYALFAWHLVSIFLLLLASWELSGRCFAGERARWGTVALMAALLTLPVAGTALYIADQYLNPRNLAAFAGLFAVKHALDGKHLRASLWLIFALACHPLMGVFAFSYCALLVLQEKFWRTSAVLPAFLPFSNFFAPGSAAYHEAARFHGFHYIMNWQWYEWLGIVAPAPIFWWLARVARGRSMLNVARMCDALVIYNLAYFAAGLLVSVPKQFESLARIQPLRSLHLLYMLLIVIGGGFIADYILKDRWWRWVLFFLPLCTGMFIAQREIFPASSHIEWPWATPKNQWEQAFLWVRQNTPIDAVFALDPLYMQAPGDDMVGFRANAERSRLADAIKDSGAVSMFPPLGEEWWEQFQAQQNWTTFQKPDFMRLRQKYGVGWVVLQSPGISGLDCPYRNSAVMVCKI